MFCVFLLFYFELNFLTFKKLALYFIFGISIVDIKEKNKDLF